MVDPIGNKASVTPLRRVAPVAAPAAPAKSADGGAAVESTAAALATSMAAQPPVDAERVARIRKAVQEGRFPIYPADAADRLLALKLEWNPNE